MKAGFQLHALATYRREEIFLLLLNGRMDGSPSRYGSYGDGISLLLWLCAQFMV